MRNVVERGPWMESMRKALRLATAGDYGGALVLYSRLAEVRGPCGVEGGDGMCVVCVCA